jgi:hypothetical protein
MSKKLIQIGIVAVGMVAVMLFLMSISGLFVDTATTAAGNISATLFPETRNTLLAAPMLVVFGIPCLIGGILIFFVLRQPEAR